MSQRRQSINPFHFLTGLLGTIFTVTACGYGLLMVRANRGPAADDTHPLMRLLNSHGATILVVEVGLLGLAAVAAILLDHYRGKSGASRGG
jgi:hypothetical protein